MNLKNKIMLFLTALAGILGLAFLYEKNKAQVNDALINNDKVKDQIREQDSQIDSNNVQLKNEEDKRKELNNEQIPDTPNVVDLAKFFNSRK